MNNSVIVIGAGITGLVAAYTLSKTYPGNIVVVEGAASVGGKIVTEQRSGCLLELGPDTIHDRGGVVYSLLSELGLSEDIIVPLQSGYSVLHKGTLHAVDSGIMGSLSGKARAICHTRAVSLTGKMRAVLGNLSKPSENSTGDISIADYSRRRWGREFSQIIVEPLLAGIHGGDSSRLSMKALYPHLLHANSKQMGASQTPSQTSPKTPMMFTLKKGLSSLAERLTTKLPEGSVKLQSRATSVDVKQSGEVKVTLESGEELVGAACILATPASESAALVAESLPKDAKILSSIPFASTIVVTLGLSLGLKKNTPYGNGIIGTEFSDSAISVCTWSSLKWRGRAPEEILLARCFLNPNRKEQYLQYTNDKLSQVVSSDLQRILGTTVRPLFIQIKRWENAFPQYELGHLEKVRQLEECERAHPTLRFAGASFRGASITSCIKDAERVAAKVHATLSTLQTAKDKRAYRPGAHLSGPECYNTEELQNV